MNGNIRKLTRTIILFVALFISFAGCTDLGMMGEEAQIAFNEASVADDSEKLTDAAITFASGDTAASVTADFSLPASGDDESTITWSSSNTDILTINEDGSTTVTRPSGSNVVVELTATITKGTVTATKIISVTVLAVEVVQHTITFNANGGTGSMGIQTLQEGATAPLTANTFTKDNYTFSGWATTAEGSVVYADGVSYEMGSADVTFYAVWTAVPASSYAITFNANDGSGSVSTQTIQEGATATLNANTFTRDGYTFNGWATAPGGSAGEYADGASYEMGSSDVMLYAVWTAVPASSYAITFNANTGSGSMDSQILQEGATAPLTVNTFTRDGHTFAGWATTAGGSVAYANQASFTMGSSNVTLYAVWTAITHTITFNANDGSGSVSTQTIQEGATATLNANTFTRDSYIFSGWTTAPGGSAVDYADGASYVMGSSDVMLYAIWTITHTITFDANGGDGSMSAQTIAQGASANLTANAFTKADHTFSGWATTAGGTIAYVDGASYTMGSSNVTLYAVWEAITHTITFDANGGDGSMSAQTIAQGASANLTANAFTKADHTFAGWSTTAGGIVAYVDGASYAMGSSNITLYAVWEAITHTITFNAYGGDGSMSAQTIAQGASAELTANAFTRAGYTFAGWDDDSDGVVDYTDGASYTMGNSDVTLYAVWRENLSISSITPDGETAVSPDTNIVIKFSGSLDGTTKGTVSFASPAVTFTDANASITFSTTTNTNDTITINPDADLQATNHTSITVSGFKDTYSTDITTSDSAYYFPVRGAMDLYFPFTDGSLTDASGRGVTLVPTGGPTLTAGYPRDAGGNDAYSFDGIDDYMQVSGDLGIDCDADFTISAWIYLTSIGNYKAIVSNYHTVNAKGLMFRVNSSWAGHTNALDLSEGYSNNGVLSTGTWLHVVGVYTESNSKVQFYVNGVGAGNPSTGYNIVDPLLSDSRNKFAIGADYLFGGDPRYFPGTIDEVRFYKYELTATEVGNLYRNDDINDSTP